MGRKNELRDAEIALIEQAIEHSRAWTPDMEPAEARRLYNDLCIAVDRYMSFKLRAADTPALGRNHPETSREAAESLGNLGQLAMRIFDEIALVFVESGTGLTADQVEQILGGKHQTVSARVNELRERGWIKDSGIRRPTRSGRRAIVWQPTQKAMMR